MEEILDLSFDRLLMMMMMMMIENTIEEKLNVIFNIKYRKLHSKLDRLMQEQIKTPDTRESFHPRLINKN